MSYHLHLDADGWVLGVFDAPDDSLPLVPAPSLPGPAPSLEARLRLLAGALVWQDPRTPAQRSADARTRRDALLAACDWLVTRAMETGQPVPLDWAAYRQALREIPQQPGFPDAIDWPNPPTEP